MTFGVYRAMGLASLLGCAACSEVEIPSEPQLESVLVADSGQNQVTTPPPELQVRTNAIRSVRPTPAAEPLVAAARGRLKSIVIYDGRYMRLDYPNGDVPATMGVCTDVIIRSLRKAYALDLQQLVHEDMKANFSAYPTNWGLTRPDRSIDHRRVPNLETYFTRAGEALPITANPSDYKPGDIVSWRLDSNSGHGGLPHIGIVSERLSRSGTPLIIHNIGGGVEESDMLFDHRITGHFRVKPRR